MADEAGQPDLDDLVARTLNKTSSPHKCWALTLEPDATRFIERIVEIDKATPGRVNRAEVRRILEAEWGATPSKEAVGRHFRGECRCAKR